VADTLPRKFRGTYLQLVHSQPNLPALNRTFALYCKLQGIHPRNQRTVASGWEEFQEMHNYSLHLEQAREDGVNGGVRPWPMQYPKMVLVQQKQPLLQ
jgi:hypothetical protein